MSWPGWRLRRRLGVVLGGGAALGAFQVGVIDVLVRRQVVPDLLVGTSIGAINAAFWAFDPEPGTAERLLDAWTSSGRSAMLPDGHLRVAGRVVLGRNHLTTQQGLDRTLRRTTPPGAGIEDAAIPLAVVATDAASGERVVMRRGPLRPALLASAAIPVVFPPVVVGGRQLVDGGVVANCDVEAAVEAGMSDVLVVDVIGQRPPAGDSLLEVGERTASTALRRQTDLAVEAQGGRARIAILRPALEGRLRFTRFDRTTDLYRAGREAAEAFLSRHLRRGRRVRPGLFVFASGQVED
jgi:NTE family protein